MNGSAQQDRLRAYLDEVLRANRQFNLTAIRDFETAWNKHVLDSLQGLGTPFFEGAKKVIDIGSGAGFPGAILAMACPQLEMTLLEATQKKCRFLEAALAAHATNAQVLCARAEEAGHDLKYRESFDVATCRAVGSLSEVCELALPFLKVGGAAVLWRGQSAVEEIKASQRALRTLGGQARALPPYGLPDHNAIYHLVVVVKERSTPSIYPRRAGMPKQKPL